MKRNSFWKLPVLSLLIVLLFNGCVASSKHPELEGQTSGFTRLVMLDGKTVARQDLYGKKTVLLFWATWCHGSRPLIEKLNAYALTRPDLRFIAVSLDKADKLADVQERIEAKGLNNLEHAFSGNEGWDEAFTALKGDGMPYVVVLDEETRVLKTGDNMDVVLETLELIDPV